MLIHGVFSRPHSSITHWALKCIHPVQNWAERLFYSVPTRMLPRLCKSLNGHVFTAVEEIEKLRLGHTHWVVVWCYSCRTWCSCSDKVSSLVVAELVEHGSWTLACTHYHWRNWYEIVLLYKLLGIYELQSFVCLGAVMSSILLWIWSLHINAAVDIWLAFCCILSSGSVWWKWISYYFLCCWDRRTFVTRCANWWLIWPRKLWEWILNVATADQRWRLR